MAGYIASQEPKRRLFFVRFLDGTAVAKGERV
jgi:hypothetical protein